MAADASVDSRSSILQDRPDASPAPSPASSPPLLLAGPTAVGKSKVALLLAEMFGGEIVSVDSMQVYRGLDIGTAKPSAEERKRIPHHLVDVADLTQSFDAAQFVRLAHEAIAQIQARKRVPLLCGGTGLYFKAYLEGLGEAPPADAALRAELEATPMPELLCELAKRDPATFERIDRQNPRRVIRALEVIRLTGKPFSVQRAAWSAEGGIRDAASAATLPASRSPLPAPHFIGLVRSPEELHARIHTRVDEMFRRGLVAETEQLLKQGLAENKTAMQALGYRQVVEYLRGERSLSETIELVKVRTRQYAKRQMTWFRRQLEVKWVQMGEKETPATIAGRFAEELRPSGTRT